MARLLSGVGQVLWAAWGMEIFRIGIIIIGRQYGVFARPDGMMSRIVAAAAAQPSQDAAAFVVGPMVSLKAVQRPLHGAHPRQEEARENRVNNHFRDGLHVSAAMQSKGGRTNSIPQ